MLNEFVRIFSKKGEVAVVHGNIFWKANHLLSMVLIAYSAFLMSSRENANPHCLMTDTYIEEFCHGRNTYVFNNISIKIKGKWQQGLTYLDDNLATDRRNLSFVYNMPWILIFIGCAGFMPEWLYKKYDHGNLEDLLWTRKKKEKGLFHGRLPPALQLI